LPPVQEYRSRLAAHYSRLKYRSRHIASLQPVEKKYRSMLTAHSRVEDVVSLENRSRRVAHYRQLKKIARHPSLIAVSRKKAFRESDTHERVTTALRGIRY
jgi:hypothetical protein